MFPRRFSDIDPNDKSHQLSMSLQSDFQDFTKKEKRASIPLYRAGWQLATKRFSME
jgi:hypothetical protein